MPLAAKELLNIPIAERQNGTQTNIIVRGVQPASRKLRPDFRIVAGRDFVEGRGECIVSRRMSARFKRCAGWRQARFRRQGELSGRRHLHGRRQRGRERGLGRLEGRREEYRPRRLGLVRPAPRGQPEGLRRAPENDRRTIPGSSWRRSPSRSISRPRAGPASSSRGRAR